MNISSTKCMLRARAVTISDFHNTIIVAKRINEVLLRYLENIWGKMVSVKFIFNYVYCVFFWQINHTQNIIVRRESVCNHNCTKAYKKKKTLKE